LVAAAKGDQGAAWIAAATLDRYLQSVRQPQIYGTQFLGAGAAGDAETLQSAADLRRAAHRARGAGSGVASGAIEDPAVASALPIAS